MGDHRATISISFHFHGTEYKHEWWINWSPNSDGIDDRITEWFRESADDGYRRYEAATYEADCERRDAEIKRKELEELARLKAKYELGTIK